MKRTALIFVSMVALSLLFDNFTFGQGVPSTAPSVSGAAGNSGARRGGPGNFRPGPPAPVPPEVAMPRPTTAELTQINDAVRHFVETDNSAAKSVLQKYQSLLHVEPLRANPCIAPVPRNAQRHASFVDLAKKGDIDLLFEGDSITDFWATGGKNAFQKYFGDMKVGNFAISGDTTQGVLWGLQNGEGQGFQPKAIMIMIGTNNSGNCSAGEIAEGVGAIVLENRKDFPNAKILLLAIFPRGDPGDSVRAKISEINKTIARLDDHQHVFFMDIGPKFLDQSGVFLPDTFRPDKLHPVEGGYEIWGTAVKDTLVSMMK